MRLSKVSLFEYPGDVDLRPFIDVSSTNAVRSHPKPKPKPKRILSDLLDHRPSSPSSL